jgi:hypothetical protein
MPADCQSCVASYKHQYAAPAGGQWRDPYGVCSDCNSLACPYHGLRRTTGGFICIQCDPAALTSSGAVKSTAHNRLHTQLLSEAGRGRSTFAWVQPSVQEYALSFADPATGGIPDSVVQMLEDVDRLRSRLNRQAEDVPAMAARIRRLLERRPIVSELAEFQPPEVSIAEQVRDIWFQADDEGQRLIVLGVLQSTDLAYMVHHQGSAVFATAFELVGGNQHDG